MNDWLKKRKFLYGLLVAPGVMLLYVLYAAYLGRSDRSHIDSFCSERSCECSDWHRESVGNYQVENNVWNKGEIRSYQQCAAIREGTGGIDAGWAWNWPGVRFNVVAYPNILYGKSPWLLAPSPTLPMRIDEIDCLEVSFDVSQVGSGKGNLSFDLWITDKVDSQPEDITHEIMIWLSHNGLRPAGSRIDTLTLDGKDIGFWKKEGHSSSGDQQWTFLAFVYESENAQGTLQLHELLSYLIENGHLEPDLYLASIQLGNEIVSGYGQTLVRDYEIQFCNR